MLASRKKLGLGHLGSAAANLCWEIIRITHCMTADIVEIKHIMLPPSPREFKDIYVVFELMETDLHQVILASTFACSASNVLW